LEWNHHATTRVLFHGMRGPINRWLARRLRRRSPKRGRRSLREIAVELEKARYLNQRGKRFAPTAVGRMLGEITPNKQLPVEGTTDIATAFKSERA
jgi:hypothetical protein